MRYREFSTLDFGVQSLVYNWFEATFALFWFRYFYYFFSFKAAIKNKTRLMLGYF